MSKVTIFSLILFLAACTTVGPAQTSTPPKPTTSPSAVSVEVEIFPPTSSPEPEIEISEPTATLPPATYYFFEPGVNPLTGLPVADVENLSRRPVMIKVSNWPREGRPHAGLTSADIVFEYFIGHQMNRFLAIYYGENAEVIGPVRSGRLVDAQLVNLYQGILAYGNADPQVDQVLIDELGERAMAFNALPCPPMCGVSTYDATGVFVDSGAMSAFADSMGVENDRPDLRGMYFQDDLSKWDAPGELLHVEYADFSIMQWHYNSESGSYHLWMEAQTDAGLILMPMLDRNNVQPVEFDNLVVMYAEYIEFASSLHDIVIRDSAGYQPALLFRDGKTTYGAWRVPEADRPIIFETPEGKPLPLKPGKTWVVIVGLQSRTQQLPDGEWEIYFGLP